MKKTFRKTLIFALTVMLLFSAFSIQSFALFDKITNVKITEMDPLTERELTDYIISLEEYEELEEEDYYYYLSARADVTISTGEVISTNMLGAGISENGKRGCSVDCYVDVREFKGDLESSKTMTVYYDVTLISSIGIELDSFKGETETELIECFVRSLVCVSGMPETYQDTGSFGIIWAEGEEEKCFLDGVVFDITYPDGRTVRDTVKSVTDEDGYTYGELDGKDIDYWVDTEEGVLEIYFEDIYETYQIEVIPFPIAEVAIGDVEVNDALEVQSVSYTVTKTDGTTIPCKTEITGEPVSSLFGGIYLGEVIDDTFPVYIIFEKGAGDEYPPRDYLNVVVVADLNVMDSKEIAGPEQEGTVLGAIIFKIVSFIRKIFALFLPIVII